MIQIKGMYKFLAVFYFAFVLTACTETEEEKDSDLVTLDNYSSELERISADQYPGLILDDVQFEHQYFAMYQASISSLSDKNLVRSPFNWQLFISMVATGAVDTTLVELSDLIHLDFNTANIFDKLGLWGQQYSSIESIENAFYFWGQNQYLFSETYLDNLQALYGTVFLQADFLADGIQAELDIRSMTDSSDVVDFLSVDSRTRIVAAHTSHLNIGWSSILTANVEQARFGNAESQVLTDMVKLEGSIGVYQSENYQATIIPLSDNSLELMVVTPNDGQFDAVRTGLSVSLFNTIKSESVNVNKVVYLPQSIVEYAFVKEAGLIVSGNEESANLSGINNTGFLHIKELRQKNRFELNDEGVLASTKNFAVLNANSDEPVYLFDFPDDTSNSSFGSFSVSYNAPIINSDCYYSADAGPYLFVLYEKDSNTILYTGSVTEVDGESLPYDWTSLFTFSAGNCGLSPPVSVYKYKGSVQCDFESGTNISIMEQQLIDAGIEVGYRYESYDNFSYPAVCGGSDGRINVFEIYEHQLEQAQELGFKFLSYL